MKLSDVRIDGGPPYDFELYELLEDFIRRECQEDQDLEFILESLGRGDIVAGFSQGHSEAREMFVVPHTFWRSRENQEKIRQVYDTRHKQKKSELFIDVGRLGAIVLGEIATVVAYLKRPKALRTPLVVTQRHFGKLPPEGVSREQAKEMCKKIRSIAATFIMERNRDIAPMIDVSNKNKIYELMGARTGRPRLMLPDLFWIDAIKFINDHQIKYNTIIKQDAFIEEFQSRVYLCPENKKEITKNAIRERCREIWSIFNRDKFKN